MFATVFVLTGAANAGRPAQESAATVGAAGGAAHAPRLAIAAPVPAKP